MCLVIILAQPFGITVRNINYRTKMKNRIVNKYHIQ